MHIKAVLHGGSLGHTCVACRDLLRCQPLLTMKHGARALSLWEANPGLSSTPETPEAAEEAGNGQVPVPAGTGAAKEVASSAQGTHGPSIGAVEGHKGVEKAWEGAHQLPPAKSGKLESKERISAMLQHTSASDSAAQQPEGANGKAGRKVGCFGAQRDTKESSKPCVIF